MDQWDLRIGEPFAGGAGGRTLRATLPDGTPAVLKHVHPHRESEHEAEALERWDGEGAVRLLARDGWTLLLERCEPGEPLSRLGGEAALDVLVGLLPRLWVAAGPPFRSVAEEAAWWRSYLPGEWERVGRPFGRRLLDAALDALTVLPDSQGEQVLVNQDLHGDNVLSARREPWLVIDPKPLLAEREFALAPIIRSAELGHSRKAVLHRLDRLSADLGLDRERARLWALGATIAWAIGGPPSHVEVAGWLA
jgi:streptomycin 6-kinase